MPEIRPTPPPGHPRWPSPDRPRWPSPEASPWGILGREFRGHSKRFSTSHRAFDKVADFGDALLSWILRCVKAGWSNASPSARFAAQRAAASPLQRSKCNGQGSPGIRRWNRPGMSPPGVRRGVAGECIVLRLMLHLVQPRPAPAAPKKGLRTGRRCSTGGSETADERR